MDELDMDYADGLPDEPIRDWWTFDDNPGGLVAVAALGFVAVAGTASLVYAALTRRR